MTFGQLTVIALRIAVPLMILRRPLAGGIAALLLDVLDVVIVELFGPAGMGQHYHSIDKVLDLYYLGLEAWVSRRWLPLTTRWISLVLYGYRALGAIPFEIVHWRALLFVFPNLFENWFLFVLVAMRFFPGEHARLASGRRCLLWLAVLYAPRQGQEYLLHVAEAQRWDWIKGYRACSRSGR